MHARRITTILLVLCLVAGGCGRGSGGDGGPQAEAIEVWIMQPGSPALEQFFRDAEREFESANAGRTVDITFVQWAQAHQQFVSSLGAGTLPDLAEMGTTWNPEFAAVGALGEVEAAGGDYVQALLDSATVDGRQYGLPWYAGARALIYRKDVLAGLGLEPPATWEDLLTTGREIQRRTDHDAFGVYGKGTHVFLPMIWQAGGEIATQKDGRWTATVDSPEAVRAIQFYADLFAKEKFAPPGALNWNSLDVRSAFANGDLAMMVGGAWDVEAILKAKPDLQDKIGTALLPAGPAGSRDAFAGGSNLAIFEQSEHKDLARAFADFLLAPERVRDFSAQLGFLPGTMAGLRAAAQGEDALHAPFRTQLEEHSRAYPAAPQWGTFEGENLFVTAVQEVMQGKRTAADAMKAVAQRMNEGFAAA